MVDATTDNDALIEKAREMAKDGQTITSISKKLGISWSEARSYTPGWRGAKVKITNRLEKLAKEQDPKERKKLACEADKYVDFLYDAAKHLRGQVDGARRALNR